MALRAVRSLASLSNPIRTYSTSGPLVNVSINEKTGIATATLQRPPVNSLNLELLTELCSTLEQLEKNKSRGLILTSSSNTVFSAGLDIYEMYKPNMDRYKQFWTTLQQTWINLYGSSYPTVAVVNGHAPAGGCLLALSCEYRIMLNNFTIGLNETKLGMIAPTWFAASMRNAIGTRQTELALITGNLFTTDEALKIGLVDEVAQSKDEALEKAGKFFDKFKRIPPHARTMTKTLLRGADIQALVKTRNEEMNKLTAFINDPKLQEAIGMYLESLKQKQNK
ncbi:enoyl-CoA delta isomerase 1, mitochondrial-like [Zophobas morio]|uniref:enoyl-CoA delta isomerase 1, mitochondrial-like n=1 Tax=Zophobas morio TaxID=2755281 RepID=UPI003082C020